MCVAHDLNHFARVKVQSRQQRHGAQSLVFVVAQMTSMFPGHWRPIRSGGCQGLDTRFLVVRNSHESWFLDRPTNHSLIYDLHLFCKRAISRPFSARTPDRGALHNSDLVRSDLGLRKNSVQFGPAQLAQFVITSRFAFLVNVGRQQSIGPQLLRIAQVLRLLTGAIQHPGNRLVGKLSRLARSRQLTQGSIQSESQTLLNAKNHRVAIHLVCLSDGLISQARQRVEQYAGSYRAPLLLSPGSTNGFQSLSLLLSENQRLSSLRKCHRLIETPKRLNV
jgi:hypothetical protein